MNSEILTNQQIPDLNCGLRAMRREAALPYLRLLPPGFSCVTTITLAFLSDQRDVVYVPLDYVTRAWKSKFRFVTDAYCFILQVVRMVMYFNPLKVLMPLAIWLVVIGLGKGAYGMVEHPFRLGATVLIALGAMIVGSLALLADLIVPSRAA